ncbi:hypothetical protein [Caballeronia sordidicola]|uniref:Uncharacterized protein n=1 Tax=Caballeronia sordidicola TaxID=196367 RepID=A0A226WNU7_CABSO|nr:hypothetical protein [Caballeronia sordidicola]OXC72489.1 hypothetical protein BSU04_41925 [Caballeronia sordidicola]
MKLATVKVEYTCGLTLTDRVTLNVSTGELHLPPRLTEVMAAVGKSECSPEVSLEYRGHVLAVHAGAAGSYDVTLPKNGPPGIRRVFNSILFPTKDQRQQNGRLLHTFCAGSIVGAVGYAHASGNWDIPTVVNTASLACLGVILWYVGFQLMKGD